MESESKAGTRRPYDSLGSFLDLIFHIQIICLTHTMNSEIFADCESGLWKALQ